MTALHFPAATRALMEEENRNNGGTSAQKRDTSAHFFLAPTHDGFACSGAGEQKRASRLSFCFPSCRSFEHRLISFLLQPTAASGDQTLRVSSGDGMTIGDGSE